MLFLNKVSQSPYLDNNSNSNGVNGGSGSRQIRPDPLSRSSREGGRGETDHYRSTTWMNRSTIVPPSSHHHFLLLESIHLLIASTRAKPQVDIEGNLRNQKISITPSQKKKRID